jgi:acetyl esterase/lipase
MLYVPLHVTNKVMLHVLRPVNAAPSRLRDGVRTARRHLPDSSGSTSSTLEVLLHEPTTRKQPSAGLLWIHGGGMISGSAENVNAWASGFAADLEALVVVPEYRLAPEHPYPAAIDDCFHALQWMRENATELGIDPENIAIGGESAGAGLAAALAQRAHDAGITLRLQVLVSPMLDDRTIQRTEHDGTQALAWTPRSNRYGWTAYLGHGLGERENRPYAVPARRADLTGLAPAWIGIGTVDLFHDESVEYARRLKAAGVPCELVTVPGAHHAAEVLKPDHPLMRDFRDRRLAAMRRALTR